jgi:nicotinate phosphoribosyltransferase
MSGRLDRRDDNREVAGRAGREEKVLVPESEIDRIVDIINCQGSVEELTDKYFTHSRRVAERHGDKTVTYAVFMRRRIVAALAVAIRYVERLVPEAKVTRRYEDGEGVPAERVLFTIEGPYSKLSEIETLVLQKVGIPSVAAFNAYSMCRSLPGAAFMDMHARHASGAEMNLLAAYGAAVGSHAARAENDGVKGFVGSSQDLTAPLFGREKGIGTMPHALIGYAGGDLVEALKMFVATAPEVQNVVALVDYQGREISDSLRAARWFYEEARLQDRGKRFGVRLDTHGGRFAEGLDYHRSVETVGSWLGVEGEYNIAEHVLGTRAFSLDSGNVLIDRTRRYLFGQGVSAASVIHTRRALDNAGYRDVQIVASSGFGVEKCLVMGAARAPVDLVGTGSFLPSTLSETYTTADIVQYDNERRVKVGREFLFG